jgi:fumarate hydratase class II
VVGIVVNRKQIDHYLHNSLMLVTAIAPKVGYDKAAEVAKKAHKDGTSLKEDCLALGYLDAAEFDRLVRPETMTGPGL